MSFHRKFTGHHSRDLTQKIHWSPASRWAVELEIKPSSICGWGADHWRSHKTNSENARDVGPGKAKKGQKNSEVTMRPTIICVTEKNRATLKEKTLILKSPGPPIFCRKAQSWVATMLTNTTTALPVSCPGAEAGHYEQFNTKVPQ